MVNGLYYSSDAILGDAYALRPVITLNADVLIDTTKSGDGSEIGKEYVLKP